MNGKVKVLLVLALIFGGGVQRPPEALAMAVIATPPPGCYSVQIVPGSGPYAQTTAVSAWGGKHPHSGCGLRVKFVNRTATNPDARPSFATMLHTEPNSTKCGVAGCVRNYTNSIGDYSEAWSYPHNGWFIYRIEVYDYLVP